MRILFICKKNEMYGHYTYSRRSSGLFNSTSFIVHALAERGVHAKIVEVQDNNCIDREVSLFKPNIVVIEALWVVPEKFDVLMRLHPNVEWNIHLHSNMPFLALEGIAMGWILEYVQRGLRIIANSQESYEALLSIVDGFNMDYLPNVYITHPREVIVPDPDLPYLDICCFGALRPLKNHMLQALAAIQFAKEKGKQLRFHVNSSRVETGGAPVLKNLEQLFERQENAVLVHNKWYDPSDFLNMLENMTMGMQVSLTETFNVVSADYVTAGLPIVVSKEVRWASRYSKADEDSLDDIVRMMHRAYDYPILVRVNQWLLKRCSREAQGLWFDWVHGHRR